MKKIIIFALIVGGSIFYSQTESYSFLKNTIGKFQPVGYSRKENQLTINTVNNLKSISEYPIIDDCRKDKNVTNYDKEPENEIKTSLSKQDGLLFNFLLKKGYTIGRIRAKSIGIPSGDIVCFKYFYLGIRDDKTLAILKGEDQLKALVIKEDQLSLLGYLLFGEPNRINYKEKYLEWMKREKCPSENSGSRCVSFKYSSFPLVYDGQITKNLFGDKVLNRYVMEGYSEPVIIHKKVIINKEGFATVESQKLIGYRTGIIF